MPTDREHRATLSPPRPSSSALADYALLVKIASGGMATVYVGRKHGVAGFERLVAIKCCHPHLRDNEELSSMFLEEARLAGNVRHPNVVATLDLSDGDPLALVMEYVEGGNLANLVKLARDAGGLLPPNVVVRVLLDVLAGLHAAHEVNDPTGKPLGLIHSDVSPQNILVGVDGVARITDFGVAFAAARANVTQSGAIKGKLSYLSPEQARSLPLTRRTDVFSAGVVLWEALTGKSLFRRADAAATIGAVAEARYIPARKLTPSLPAELDAVLEKALAREPAQRFQTAAEFAAALEAIPFAAVNARAVASSVEELMGATLVTRRELIRNAPERPLRPAARPSHAPRNDDVIAAVDVLDLSDDDLVEEPPPASGARGHSLRVSVPLTDAEIEHRRMRSVIAAVMLLLVGSALGLLLSRSSPETPKPAPSASAGAKVPP